MQTYTCLSQVQWDEPASILRPERVSPWEIETFGTPVPTSLVESVAPKCKRPRPPSEVPNLGKFLCSFYLEGYLNVRL